MTEKAQFAVLYQGYLKQGRELEYQHAWHKIAAYFVEKRGAFGSSLHRTHEGLWIAYSRWPDKATRNAAWPEDGTTCNDLPDEIRQAVIMLKDCIERQLPEICMEIIYHLQRQNG